MCYKYSAKKRKKCVGLASWNKVEIFALTFMFYFNFILMLFFPFEYVLSRTFECLWNFNLIFIFIKDFLKIIITSKSLQFSLHRTVEIGVR